MHTKMTGVSRATGRRTFTMEADRVPTKEEIGRAQARAGFDPAGYGGPMNIAIGAPKDTVFEVKWECYASCE